MVWAVLDAHAVMAIAAARQIKMWVTFFIGSPCDWILASLGACRSICNSA